MKWNPKNIRETMYPLLVLNWLTGVGLTDYPIGNRRPRLFLIGVIAILIFAWTCSIYTEYIPCHETKGTLIRLSKVNLYFDTLVATSAMLIGWLNREVSDNTGNLFSKKLY